jgi:hypothetical protein
MEKKLFLLLLFVFTLLHFSQSFAQPQQIHLSWNSTKNDATENTMAITWAENNLNNSVIKYGTDNKLLMAVKASPKYSDSGKIYIYKASLKGLRPGTTYYYRCGSDKRDGARNTPLKQHHLLALKVNLL